MLAKLGGKGRRKAVRRPWNYPDPVLGRVALAFCWEEGAPIVTCALRSARICLRWHVSEPSSMRTLLSPLFQTTQPLIGVMNFPHPLTSICALPPGYSAISLDLLPHYSLSARYKTNGAHHSSTHMCLNCHRQLMFEFWIYYRTILQFLIAFVLGAAALWLAYAISR